jgi:DNA-binding response OmpR family regulator
MRILIIEDEEKIARFVERGLKEEAFETVIALRGDEGFELALTEAFDLIVLDVKLPGMDGFAVARELRKKGSQAKIIMLSARDAVEDKVLGLDSGADDYLTKPFSFDELLARVRALLRRGESAAPELHVADLTLDQRRRRVTRGGKEIGLSNREYALLEYLMLNADSIVSRARIAEHVWGIDFDTFTNTIDVYIRYLREKIDVGSDTKLIHTVRGRGYCLSERPPL